MSKSGQLFFERQEQEERADYYGEIKRKPEEKQWFNMVELNKQIQEQANEPIPF
jgi:hypothetical protein